MFFSRNYLHLRIQNFLALFLLALFFSFSFFEDTILNSISQNLIQSYHFSPFELSFFSTIFFISSGIFFVLCSIWLKNNTIKFPILISASLFLIGTLLLMICKSFFSFAITRVLIGLGYSFAFVCCMQYVAMTHHKYFSLTMGLISALLVLFGMLAQGPFVYLVDNLGLQIALLINFIFSFLILVGIFYQRKKYDSNQICEKRVASSPRGFLTLIRNRNLFVWSAYASFVNAPILFLGSLWGNIYLVASFGLSRKISGLLLSLMFLGLLLGCIILGFLGNHLKKRKKAMLICPAFMVILTIPLFSNINSVPFFGIILFFLGFLAAAQTLVYPEILNSLGLDKFSLGVGITTFSIMIISAILQLFFGALLKLGLNAMVLLPLCLSAASLKSILSK